MKRVMDHLFTSFDPDFAKSDEVKFYYDFIANITAPIRRENRFEIANLRQ